MLVVVAGGIVVVARGIVVVAGRTEVEVVGGGGVTSVCKRRIVPPLPTVNTSLAELPQIPERFFVVPLAISDDQVPSGLPSYWRMVPPLPTVKTLLPELPQIPESTFVVPLFMVSQTEPL
jgi:hypothetical protein